MTLEHTTLKINGINMHVVQAGNTDGEPLLLLHGFPEFWYAWRNQIEPLTQAGFRLWMPDLRGYNLTDKPSQIEAYSLDVLAKDIVGLIDAMGIERGKVVGHDWGGGALWWALNKMPDRFERAVILNVPHHAVLGRFLKQSAEQRRRVRYMAFFQLPFIPEMLFTLASDLVVQWAFGGKLSKDDVQQYKQMWAKGTSGMLNWYRAARQACPQRLDSQRIQTPTLLIWGCQDKAFLREMAQPSVALCDEGRVEYIENASHWVQHDDPERVNELIVEFMRRPPLPKQSG